MELQKYAYISQQELGDLNAKATEKLNGKAEDTYTIAIHCPSGSAVSESLIYEEVKLTDEELLQERDQINLLELVSGVTKPVARHRITVSTEDVAPLNLTDIEVFEISNNFGSEV